MRALLLALLLSVCAAPAMAATPSAPAFSLPLLDGSGTFDSRALIGKKVLIVRFQASWCKVCAQEAAMIERLYEQYRESGVELISVQVQDTETDARRFLKAHDATYPAGLDPRLKTANRFGFAASGTGVGTVQGAGLAGGNYVGYTTSGEVAFSATGPTNGDTIALVNRAKINNLQPADTYTGTITYTVTPGY